MASVEVTGKNFEKLINENGIVLLDFWASWCGPCKMFGPIFETSSEKHKDIVFGKVNTEEEQELAGAFGIRSIPTLMIFRDKILLFQQAGALPESALEEVIGKVRDLDMNMVRAEIEKEQANHEHGPGCNHGHGHDDSGHGHKH